jgi:hypothetical protein
MIPTFRKYTESGRSKQVLLSCFIYGTLLLGLITVNRALPFPDISDFRGLGMMCELIDTDIRYCVNNNWGFALPLSCWLLTKLTGDLFISQRLICALAISVYLILLIRMVRYAYGGLSLRSVGCILLFLCSPWMVEAAISTHLDILPITLVFAAGSLIVQRKGITVYAAAGLMAGGAYWFRFHFLPMALLLPLLAWIARKERQKRFQSVLAAAAGVLSAILVPHLLCLIAYGVFSISNERFVLAEALGMVDWSYEGAVKVANMRIIDLFQSFNAKKFILAYGYHFITSGLFPMALITAIAVKDYFYRNGKTIKAFFTGSDTHRQIILFTVVVGFAIIPFTLLRSFTFRLEAAFVLCAIPLVVGMVSSQPRNTVRIVFILAFFCITVQHLRYWPDFVIHKRNVIAIERVISQKIPQDVLANRPNDVICCVEYYNPHNKYKLCNMVLCGGWGVRFKPMIEHFGLLNLIHPFENKTFVDAEYIIFPFLRDVINSSDELLIRDRILYKDKNIVIIHHIKGADKTQ